MAYTFDELKGKTVAELRQIADGIENEILEGHNAMHKDKLLPLLCKALGIETHAHHEVVGINKREIKAQIKALKGDRDTALAAHDHKQLKAVRRRIHRLKREIHKYTV
jgi:hypothetical protein